MGDILGVENHYETEGNVFTHGCFGDGAEFFRFSQDFFFLFSVEIEFLAIKK